MLSPNDKIHSSIGYRISDVNGSRFFNDARDVNGSLVSKYQSPFVNFAWTVRRGLICKRGVQLLRLRRGRPFRQPVLQHHNLRNRDSCSLQLGNAHSYPTGLTETIRRPDRAEKLSRQ